MRQTSTPDRFAKPITKTYIVSGTAETGFGFRVARKQVGVLVLVRVVTFSGIRCCCGSPNGPKHCYRSNEWRLHFDVCSIISCVVQIQYPTGRTKRSRGKQSSEKKKTSDLERLAEKGSSWVSTTFFIHVREADMLHHEIPRWMAVWPRAFHACKSSF